MICFWLKKTPVAGLFHLCVGPGRASKALVPRCFLINTAPQSVINRATRLCKFPAIYLKRKRRQRARQKDDKHGRTRFNKFEGERLFLLFFLIKIFRTFSKGEMKCTLRLGRDAFVSQRELIRGVQNRAKREDCKRSMSFKLCFY